MRTLEELEAIYIAAPTFAKGLADVYNMGVQDAADNADVNHTGVYFDGEWYNPIEVDKQSILELLIK